jgi:3-isopropylmalate dehydrogenase
MHKPDLPEDPIKDGPRGRWSDCLREDARSRRNPSRVIGVLTGEGVGPEVIGCALHVLSAVESVTGRKFAIEFGASIGRDAERDGGKVLPDEVIEFCRGIFARGGAVLSGPGGGRYVYDLRRVFDLFCKLSPLKVSDELAGANGMKPEHVRGVDILMVRENSSGLYQGKWTEARTASGRVAEHSFSYSETDVRRILRVAAALAKSRRGHLTVVSKEAGVPSISALWHDCAVEISARVGVHCSLLDIDHIAFRLIQHPRDFDVVVAPNLFGDVLSDLGGVLLGSRGLCFAGSFSGNGDAVYSTNHGAAYDLAGSDKANPVAQILSLSMLLRESFHMEEEARLIEGAVAGVYRKGWRTADVAEPGRPVIGTREMGERIAQALASINDADGLSHRSTTHARSGPHAEPAATE